MSSKQRFKLKRDLLLLQQRVKSQEVFVYNGCMFRADSATVAYAQTIQDGTTIIDTNQTPCKIENAEDFQRTLKLKHNEILNEYDKEYQTIIVR